MKKLTNDQHSYGLVSIVMHGVVAILVPALYLLGLWMVTLDYYHGWYHTAPDIHRIVGVFVLLLMVIRLGWRIISISPPLLSSRRWENKLALIMHYGFYVVILLLGLSGYLVVTAAGAELNLFAGIRFPALVQLEPEMANLVGQWHAYLSHALMLMFALHVLGALKHYFADGDDTLIRMFKIWD